MEHVITASGGVYTGTLTVDGEVITEAVRFGNVEIWRSTWPAEMQPEAARANYLASMTLCAAEAHERTLAGA